MKMVDILKMYCLDVEILPYEGSTIRNDCVKYLGYMNFVIAK